MTTIIKYRIYCNTDDKWEETWRSNDDPALTTCPVNNTHNINGSSLQELETISESVIKIDEEGSQHSTGKHFRSESYTIVAPTGTSLHQYTWKKPISVCEIKFGASKEHFGDVINNKIGGHIPVGYLTTSVETGATELNVNDTVNQYSKIGYLIEIKNSDEKDEIGEILINNKIDNKLTLDNPTSKTYNTGTAIYLQTQIIKDYKITVNGFNEIGVFRKSSSYLTPGTPSNVYYTNNGTGTKEITFYIEYLY